MANELYREFEALRRKHSPIPAELREAFKDKSHVEYFRRFDISGGLRETRVKSSASAEWGPIATASIPRPHNDRPLRRIVGPRSLAR